jgi:hypothetical protein
MPKKQRSEAAPPQEAAGSGKRNPKAEYLALMTWLSQSENRNIISGAAGAAQNNGGMASGKLVVSKSQGHVIQILIPFIYSLSTLTLNRWTMLAKYLSDQLGTTFDSSQAENKLRYYEQKYHKAKLASQVSGFGVDDADRAKGIHTIEQKMESMCSSYALWDTWFGSSQKYSPTSVISAHPPDLDSDDDAGQPGSGALVEENVNEQDGGFDGAADDAAAAAELSQISAPGDAGDEAESQQADVQLSVQSQTRQPSAKGLPRKSATASPGAGAVAAATGAKNNLLAIVATSPSSINGSSSSSKSSSNFDQVYASVQAAKSAQIQSPCINYSSRFYAAQAQLDIARSHNEHEICSQTRGFSHDQQKQEKEFAFQSQLARDKLVFEAEAKALELAARRADQQADRNVRQRIEFEKNVTQLLEKDPTGELAKNLVTFVDGRFGMLQRPEQQDPVATLLEKFMSKYS